MSLDAWAQIDIGHHISRDEDEGVAFNYAHLNIGGATVSCSVDVGTYLPFTLTTNLVKLPHDVTRRGADTRRQDLDVHLLAPTGLFDVFADLFRVVDAKDEHLLHVVRGEEL